MRASFSLRIVFLAARSKSSPVATIALSPLQRAASGTDGRQDRPHRAASMAYKEFMNKTRTGQSIKYMDKPSKENYPHYADHKCIVRKFLTEEVYERLYNKVTPNGVTLDKCIQPSVDFTGKTVGLMAGDEECYDVFAELFDPCINLRHNRADPNAKHPAPELEPGHIKGGQWDDKYVRSCRVRTGRSIKGTLLPPCCSRAERRETEKILTDALGQLKGDLNGDYYPLSKLTPADENRLIADHFLFQKPDGHLMVCSGAARDWPDGRGIWHNKNKNFLVWINEEDQCRVISMQQGADMLGTFERFCRGLKEIEALMKAKGNQFMWSERLGFLGSSPSNIGTALRCSVHIQLKKLTEDFPRFDKLCKALKLQWRGTGGEHTDAVDSVYDISNSTRVDLSEVQFVQRVIDGVDLMIKMEQRLEKGESIDDLLPELPDQIDVNAY